MLAKLKTWLWSQAILKTLSIGKAAAYTIANWEGVSEFPCTAGGLNLETAKLHNVDPARYLQQAVLAADSGEVLLPWQLSAAKQS